MSGSYRQHPSYCIIQGLTDEAVMDNIDGRKISDPVREQIR